VYEVFDQRYRKENRRSIARDAYAPSASFVLAPAISSGGDLQRYIADDSGILSETVKLLPSSTVFRGADASREGALCNTSLKRRELRVGPLAEILSKGTLRLWFWKRFESAAPIVGNFRARLERTRFKNCFVTRYRHAMLVKRSARNAPFGKIGPRRGGVTRPRFKQLTYRLLRINGDLIFYSNLRNALEPLKGADIYGGKISLHV